MWHEARSRLMNFRLRKSPPCGPDAPRDGCAKPLLASSVAPADMWAPAYVMLGSGVRDVRMRMLAGRLRIGGYVRMHVRTYVRIDVRMYMLAGRLSLGCEPVRMCSSPPRLIIVALPSALLGPHAAPAGLFLQSFIAKKWNMDPRARTPIHRVPKADRLYVCVDFGSHVVCFR